MNTKHPSTGLDLSRISVFLILLLILYSCDSHDCTRMATIGGGLIPKQEIEVPCDFPEPEPLGKAIYLKGQPLDWIQWTMS